MERVKQLREAKGLSLRDLARTSGVSAPMLSQVERGETSPTLQVAAKIAAGLDLTLSQLLRLDEAPGFSITRADGAPVLQEGAHAVRQLTPPMPGQPHLVTEHSLTPGAATGGTPLHEPGGRETVIVGSGAVDFVVGEERHVLRAGDTVTFDADLPHHFENTGKREATFIAVVTAGLRRV